MSVEEIAKVVAAALHVFDGSATWDQMSEQEQAIMVHGVRVIQEGNDEADLYRQTKAAEAGDSGLDTRKDWAGLEPLSRRHWFLFAGVVRPLSYERELYG